VDLSRRQQSLFTGQKRCAGALGSMPSRVRGTSGQQLVDVASFPRGGVLHDGLARATAWAGTTGGARRTFSHGGHSGSWLDAAAKHWPQAIRARLSDRFRTPLMIDARCPKNRATWLCDPDARSTSAVAGCEYSEVLCEGTIRCRRACAWYAGEPTALGPFFLRPTATHFLKGLKMDPLLRRL